MSAGGSSATSSTGRIWDSRWRGQPGRLEVWYGTFTDAATGAGLWLHHERVSPSDGSELRTDGWVAHFPSGGAPRWERTKIDLRRDGSAGSAAGLDWDLTWADDTARPLYTFPRWAWERELLPAAQVVAAPRVHAVGTVAGEPFAGAGGLARIYGHGNALRWAWLHADLGDGDLIEVVSAVSTRPGLRSLPPVTHLRARIDGRDWPPAVGPSFGLRARLSLPAWTVSGRIGRRPVRLTVTQPADRCVAIDYHDPDGATATCTNTERADLDLVLGDRRWHLDATAHAEVGTRP